MTPNLEALASRVETEPASDDLSYAVARAFGWRPGAPEHLWQYWRDPQGELTSIPHWLRSVDAALSLLPPGYFRNINWYARYVMGQDRWIIEAHCGLFKDFSMKTSVEYTSICEGDYAEPRAIVAAMLRLKAKETP